MSRDGPGFLEDLVLLWLTLVVWIGLSEFAVTTLNVDGVVATVVALGIGTVVAFVGLYGYYRLFLDEKPLQSA
ncbi:hypothetical protein [Halopiger goleimassiliensis]|uniref:hypothetical protein n=1 Tax=Halopiger goleimassiliensis TaxID=1293048 RepID=UPI0006779C70|nr:hypothetical protein [Halopiger goleimassiliensis]